MIVSLQDSNDVAKFGGKATNLAILLGAGFQVPVGWAVSHDSFDAEGKLKGKVELDKSKLYAVRSSATVEDAGDKSWAGQFETFLYVKPADVVKKIEECHATSKKRTKAYAAQAGSSDKFKVAVVVQEMIDPKYAGVLFTKDPVSITDSVVVEYVKGIGEQLVSGKTTPEQFIWDRTTKKISSKKAIPFLPNDLIDTGLKIEATYNGAPQDIEWAIDKTGQLWILQTRPVTTLAKQKTSRELSKFYETQIPFTEWLDKIGHADAKAMRVENNYKRERLGDIASIIPFPFDKPTTFESADLRNRTPKLKKFVAEHGEELCALRLIPRKGTHAPMVRNRGKKIKDAVVWSDEQDIKIADYTAEFVPHMEANKWSTIFVVNDKGIFGEIISDGHSVLTQGFYGNRTPHVFTFDFKKWEVVPHDSEALEHLKILANYLNVDDTKKQSALKKKVDAEFAQTYMKGYFETVFSEETGTWFIDYSRTLGRNYSDFKPILPKSGGTGLQGQVASAPVEKVSGRVRIVDDPEGIKLEPDEILVCSMTSPDYIPLMTQAKAVVTDQGGILCHAAIVAREIKKPCIVGTIKATQLLKTGDKVTLNLADGSIKKA